MIKIDLSLQKQSVIYTGNTSHTKVAVVYGAIEARQFNRLHDPGSGVLSVIVSLYNTSLEK